MTSSSFLSLGVPENLAAVLEADGKTLPFPIQRDTLPDSLAGRDVLGRGRTGSGKTIAFAVPLVARLAGGRRRPSHPRPAPSPRWDASTTSTPHAPTSTRSSAAAAPRAEPPPLGGLSRLPHGQARGRRGDIVFRQSGPMAQLVARLVRNEKVGGSNPPGSTV